MAEPKQSKIIKVLPPKELKWMHQITGSGLHFYITSNKDRSSYMLYKQVPDGFLLLSKATSPVTFNDVIAKLNPSTEDSEVKVRKTRRVKK